MLKAIGNTEVGKLMLGNLTRCKYLAQYNQILYREIVKIATGIDIEILDTKNDYANITKIEGNSTQTTSIANKNLFDKNRAIVGAFIDRNTGGLTAFATAYFSDYILVNSSTSYKFSGNEQPTNTPYAWYTEAKVYISGGLNVANAITSPSNAKYIRFTINSSAGLPTIQIEQGTTATSYEAFVPNSPSSNYPSPIINSGDGGTVTLWSHKKNLFSCNLESGTMNSLNQLIENNTRLRTADFIKVSENTTYYLKVKETNIQCTIFYFNKESTTAISLTSFLNVPLSITTPTNTYRIKIVFKKIDNSIINISDISEIQLELGTTATAYEPYQGAEYPITLPSGYIGGSLPNLTADSYEYVTGGKNLYNKTTVTFGKYLNNLGQEVTLSSWYISDYINISNLKDITLSPVTGTSAALCFYDSNKVFLSGTAYGGDKLFMSFNVPNNAKYTRFSIYTYSVNNTQLEIGTIATDTQPYGLQSGKYLVKRIGKLILNGSEIYSELANSTDGYKRFGLTNTLIKICDFNKICCYCDKFLGVSMANNSSTVIGYKNLVSVVNASGMLAFRTTSTTYTTTDFKNLLANNNIIVQYPLAMPIYIDTTLPQIQTYLDNTIITSLSNPKPNLTLEYLER